MKGKKLEFYHKFIFNDPKLVAINLKQFVILLNKHDHAYICSKIQDKKININNFKRI